MSLKKSYLILQDGTVAEGVSPDWIHGPYHGEVVFNTGMTGYIESLTDPSYAGQHLMFTYPLMGNYGVFGPEHWESERIHAAGAIFSEICENYSHSLANRSLLDWLKSQNVPAIFGVDTRSLTKKIRTHGALLGVISSEKTPPGSFQDPNALHLVSKAMPHAFHPPSHKGKKVIAVDCGMKFGILRYLQREGVEVKHVPYDYDFTQEEYDGLFLSNGPGDPEKCTETIGHLRTALKKGKPIFGICLGAQLLSLAAGAKTYKLPFGHRGHNQPCMELESGRCFMTSQNHGYAVDEKSLPEGWVVSFKNLNDGTVEGIRHTALPYWAVQFHPEAFPGPEDTRHLFDKFIEAL